MSGSITFYVCTNVKYKRMILQKKNKQEYKYLFFILFLSTHNFLVPFFFLSWLKHSTYTSSNYKCSIMLDKSRIKKMLNYLNIVVFGRIFFYIADILNVCTDSKVCIKDYVYRSFSSPHYIRKYFCILSPLVVASRYLMPVKGIFVKLRKVSFIFCENFISFFRKDRNRVELLRKMLFYSTILNCIELL